MKYTVYATDLDNMIDLVQAWHEGRFEAVRNAIRNKKGQTDMAEEYDNSNRIGLWARENGAKGCYVGGGPRTDFNGEQVKVAVFVTRERRTSEKAPIGDLFWATETAAYYAPIFKSEKGMGGRIEGWWVSVWDNGTEKKGPRLSATFRAMEPVASGAPSGVPYDDSDDLPF